MLYLFLSPAKYNICQTRIAVAMSKPLATISPTHASYQKFHSTNTISATSSEL